MPLPPFQRLLDCHGPAVHRFLIAMVGANDADDCYQDTWLSALRAYPRLRSAGNLRGWIFTIAQRKALDHLRARGRAPSATVQLPERPVAPPPPPGLEEELWRVVRKLPRKQRTAVALRYVADAAYAEIGAAMGTSEEAARRSVHEGLKRLREEYRP